MAVSNGNSTKIGDLQFFYINSPSQSFQNKYGNEMQIYSVLVGQNMT